MVQHRIQPWSCPYQEIVKELDVSANRGLTPGEIRHRRKAHGPNRLRETKAKSEWQILGEQFKSLMTVLLAVASVVSFLFGDWVEGLAIVAVILINAAIGFFTELRAVHSMEALYRLGRVTTRVRHDGRIVEIAPEEIVPGDIVILEGGDVATADLRLVQASKLQADELAPTGESMPMSKSLDQLGEETPLAERKNMLFEGTAVTRGSGEGLVFATGINTKLGQISSLVEQAEEEETPLEKRLDQLGQKLVWVTLATVILMAVAGIIAGEKILLMIETAIALAVAAVPEGLPIVAKIALARGMWRIARRNALVNCPAPIICTTL